MTSFETWHPIDGKWVHIVQTTDEDGARKYFTNGKLEHEELLPSNEKLKE